jgi:FkbM family methyltransferase
MKKLIQIGANIGYADGIPDYTASKLLTDSYESILVEPNPKAMEKLIEGYEKFNYNIHFENLAISVKNGTTTLYVDNYDTINSNNPPEWVPNRDKYKNKDTDIWLGCSPHASMNLDFQYAHLHGLGRDKITAIEVETITFETLLKKYNWENEEIEYLFIDTEGHDCDIILSTDFSKYKIKNLKFETTHSDGPFTKGKKLISAINHLKDCGFTIEKVDNDDVTFTK